MPAIGSAAKSLTVDTSSVQRCWVLHLMQNSELVAWHLLLLVRHLLLLAWHLLISMSLRGTLFAVACIDHYETSVCAAQPLICRPLLATRASLLGTRALLAVVVVVAARKETIRLEAIASSSRSSSRTIRDSSEWRRAADLVTEATDPLHGTGSTHETEGKTTEGSSFHA